MIIVSGRDYDRVRGRGRYSANMYYSIINEEMGTLCNVFQIQNFVPRSQEKNQRMGMGNEKVLFNDKDVILIRNWRVHARTKNDEDRLPLFIASQQNVKWSDGLGNILNGYGAAIEDVDVKTGLEAFMLAAAGKESDLETIYKLLLDHPAAINPYVILPQKQNDHSSELKKRKRS